MNYKSTFICKKKYKIHVHLSSLFNFKFCGPFWQRINVHYTQSRDPQRYPNIAENEDREYRGYKYSIHVWGEPLLHPIRALDHSLNLFIDKLHQNFQRVSQCLVQLKILKNKKKILELLIKQRLAE